MKWSSQAAKDFRLIVQAEHTEPRAHKLKERVEGYSHRTKREKVTGKVVLECFKRGLIKYGG